MALLLVDFLRKRNQKSVLYSWKIVLSPFYKGRFQGRTLSVACGDSSPERGSPWQNRQVLSSFVNDRRSQPVNHKLYALAKASTFGGGGISQSEMTEGVSSGTNPLSRLRRQLFPFLSPAGDIFPRPGEVFPLRASPWQNQQVSSTPVNGRRSQPINPKTLRPCQSLHLRGRWHGEAVTERVSPNRSCSPLPAGSAERPAYSVVFRRCKKQERRTSCFYEYCTGAGSLFLSIA